MKKAVYRKITAALLCASFLSVQAAALAPSPLSPAGAGGPSQISAPALKLPAKQATAETPAGQTSDGFNYSLEDIDTAYLFCDRDNTSVEGAFLFEGENGLSDLSLLSPRPVGVSVLGKPMPVITMQETLLKNGTKYRYSLYEKGVLVERADADKPYGNAAAYTLDAGNYAKVTDYFLARLAQGPLYSSWLSVIRPARVDSLVVRFMSGENAAYSKYDTDPARFYQALKLLSRIEVAKGSEQFDTSVFLPDTLVHTDLFFANGIRYTIYIGENYMQIASKDKNYALRYPLAKSITSMLQQLANGQIPASTEAE